MLLFNSTIVHEHLALFFADELSGHEWDPGKLLQELQWVLAQDDGQVEELFSIIYKYCLTRITPVHICTHSISEAHLPGHSVATIDLLCAAAEWLKQPNICGSA